LTTTDDVLFKDFAKWDSLTVDGIHLDMQPDKLQVDQVKFIGLNTSLMVGPDKRANLQTILRDKIGGTNAAGTNAPRQILWLKPPRRPHRQRTSPRTSTLLLARSSSRTLPSIFPTNRLSRIAVST